MLSGLTSDTVRDGGYSKHCQKFLSTAWVPGNFPDCERHCSHGRQQRKQVPDASEKGNRANAGGPGRRGRRGAFRRWREERGGPTGCLPPPPPTGRRARRGCPRPGARPGPSLTTCLLEGSCRSPAPGTAAPPSSTTALPTKSRENREISRCGPTRISRTCGGANMAARGRESLLGDFSECGWLVLGQGEPRTERGTDALSEPCASPPRPRERRRPGSQIEPSAGRGSTPGTPLDLSRPRRGSRARHVGRRARAPSLRSLPAPSPAHARARPTWGRRRLSHPPPAPGPGGSGPARPFHPRRVLVGAPRRPRHAPREPAHLSRGAGRRGPLGEAPPAWPPSAPTTALARAPSAAGSSTAAPRRFQVGPRLPLLHFPQLQRLLPVPSFLA